MEEGNLIVDGMVPAVLADYDRVDSALNRSLMKLGLDRVAKEGKLEALMKGIREQEAVVDDDTGS